MNAHTPGPWSVRADDINDDEALTISIDGADGESVGSANGFTAVEHAPGVWGAGLRGDIETVRGNARLISAAPDLLEALEEIINTEWIGGKGGFYRARAAIAKARGNA